MNEEPEIVGVDVDTDEEPVKQEPEGFEAFEKRWNKRELAEAPGPESIDACHAQYYFQQAAQRLDGGILRRFRDKFFKIQKIPVVPSDGMPLSLMVQPKKLEKSELRTLRPLVEEFLGEEKLSYPWMVEDALTTLKDWTANGFEEPDLEIGWLSDVHDAPCDLPEGSSLDLWPWDSRINTEEEVRENFEKQIRQRKIEMFKAGFVQRHRADESRLKVSVEDRFYLLAAYLLKGLTFEETSGWYEGLGGGRSLDVATIKAIVTDAAKRAQIALPPRRGRKALKPLMDGPHSWE